ncbi:hypothetical protein TNIN_142431 [Trichonephila inaurata madagascariensis]|uniref:Uncharacterized protein n=1 Tax=Trichonephila inaurata madagascariensis TaxID=2747483 RepID=A0A8X7CAT9_9ARAC|nr:hypothetical protein TNIN_142431 [Trichonephila inaurata madagascariensis]
MGICVGVVIKKCRAYNEIKREIHFCVEEERKKEENCLLSILQQAAAEVAIMQYILRRVGFTSPTLIGAFYFWKWSEASSSPSEYLKPSLHGVLKGGSACKLSAGPSRDEILSRSKVDAEYLQPIRLNPFTETSHT